jgi:hypothetical protein
MGGMRDTLRERDMNEAVANHMAEVAKLQEEMNRLINEI